MSYQNKNKQTLTIQDLVTIGVFTAIFFIFELIGAFPLMMNPATMFYMPFGIALLCGPIILLLLAKVPKRGALMIVGLVNGIIWFATGMHWGLYLGYIIMGFVADFIAGIKNYKSIQLNMLAYMLLCLAPTGSFIVYFMNPVAWASTMLNNGTSQEMINAINEAVSPVILPIILIGTLIIAFVSAMIGRKLLKKQFIKAGIIQ